MEPLTLTDLAARVARRWRVLLAAALVGLFAGAAVHLATPDRFEATAVVFVDGPDPGRVDMTAEAALASSRRVTTEALDALGDPALTLEDLERSARATPVEDSRVLRVSCSAADPRSAARRADAVAQAYLAVRALEVSADQAAGVESRVVDPARTPTSPSGPGLLPSVVAGMALGLLVAAPVAARPTRTRAARAS